MAESKTDQPEKVSDTSEKPDNGVEASTEEELVSKMTQLLKVRGFRVIAPGNVVARERVSTLETPIIPHYQLPTLEHSNKISTLGS